MEEFEQSGGLGLTYFNSLKKHKDKIFLFDSDNDRSITFSEVLSQSIRTALKLKQKGITRNDIISTCTHQHKHTCIPIIASQFLGAISANFDPNLSSIDTVHLLKLIQPKIIFVSEDALDFMKNCINTAAVDTELVVFGESEEFSQFSEFLEPHNDENSFVPVKIDNELDTALIVFSSGTTGLPKGICVSHLTLGSSRKIDFVYRITKQHVSLRFATFYWISTIYSFSVCLINGYAMVICKQFDPLRTWYLLEKYKVAVTFLAPFNATVMLKEKPKNIDVSSVEVVVTGSCSVNETLMQSLRKTFSNARVLNIYGLSEGGIPTVCYFPDDEYNIQLLKPFSCGKIDKDTQWKLVDINSGKKLGPNEEGELRIKCPYGMVGYYKMDASSAYDSEGFLKTGDIAYYDKDNCFYIKDRIKEMFKYKGWHILPAILENIVKLHPAVKEAAVVGIPHEEDGEHPMAVVVLFDDFIKTDPKDILNFVNERVADNQKLRAGVKIVHSIPKTATGKLKDMS